MKSFKDCLDGSNGDVRPRPLFAPPSLRPHSYPLQIARCQFYFDSLTQCQKGGF